MKLNLICLSLLLLLASCQNISPYEKEIILFRKDKDSFFKSFDDSPLKQEQKLKFKSLNYFPIHEKWKINGTFTLANPTLSSKHAGKVEFIYENKKYELRADWDDTLKKDKLFIPFRDKTTNVSTYGGGRYLNVIYENSNDIILDFNYTYNPYCIYNSEYICPVPYKENKLPVAIEAGEKLFD